MIWLTLSDESHQSPDFLIDPSAIDCALRSSLRGAKSVVFVGGSQFSVKQTLEQIDELAAERMGYTSKVEQEKNQPHDPFSGELVRMTQTLSQELKQPMEIGDHVKGTPMPRTLLGWVGKGKKRGKK
tara:strand:+ start:14779 stop:15159 length:381 start_codon:yes stop_codon:yes gene_type:complete